MPAHSAKKGSQKRSQPARGVKRAGAPLRVTRSTKGEAHRFAHPFFTTTPIGMRKSVPGVGKRMTDYVSTKLQPIPDPIRTPPSMTLDEIIGSDAAAAILRSGSISFHAVGDTGHAGGSTEDMQQFVADAMSADYDISHPEASPAFFFHLGDVNYFDNTDRGYQEQFYVPYKKYPGKIIAIPGNHDGEIFKYDGSSVGQTRTLQAFTRNFLQPQPSVPGAAGSIYREMVSQPGVYWDLEAPFVDIVALYSNVAEGPGYIAAPSIGQKQKVWLQQALSKIKDARAAGTRKALIIAVHHPPFSDGSHSSSTAMLKDIDDACAGGGIQPDAVLAAHSHDYQHYTRYITSGGRALEVPFIVAGGGGRGLSPHVAKATGARTGDHSLDKSLRGYGYLRVTVTARELTIVFYQVSLEGRSSQYDSSSVLLD
jgi:hypothetical protein